jgi:hypothetical protein
MSFGDIRVEEVSGWGVRITRRDGVAGLALGGEGAPRAIFHHRRLALDFCKKLRSHLPDCKLRVVRVTATYEMEA